MPHISEAIKAQGQRITDGESDILLNRCRSFQGVSISAVVSNIYLTGDCFPSPGIRDSHVWSYMQLSCLANEKNQQSLDDKGHKFFGRGDSGELGWWQDIMYICSGWTIKVSLSAALVTL